MAVDPKNIKKLIRAMRQEGVLRLKTPEIELELAPEAIQPKHVAQALETQETNAEPKYTEEDVLLWSSPGYVPGLPGAN